MYSVHLKSGRTQKLFLTCTLCSIWSRSGGKRQKSKKRVVLQVIIPIPVCFLSDKTKLSSLLLCFSVYLQWFCDSNTKGNMCHMWEVCVCVWCYRKQIYFFLHYCNYHSITNPYIKLHLLSIISCKFALKYCAFYEDPRVNTGPDNLKACNLNLTAVKRRYLLCVC